MYSSRSVNSWFTSVLSSLTSKSESCVGSWTPLRRRWRPWRLSCLPMWVCLLQNTPSKQSAHLHYNLLSESFYGSVAYRSSGRNINLWDAHQILFSLFEATLHVFRLLLVWFCLCVSFCVLFFRWGVFLCCVCVSTVQRGLSLCFCLSRWGSQREQELLPNSPKQGESNRGRRAYKGNREMRISESRLKCVMRGWNQVRYRDLQPQDGAVFVLRCR